MKAKIATSLIWLLLLAAVGTYLHQGLAPRQASDLALQQLSEDGAREKLRILEQWTNWIDIGLLAAGTAGLAGIWRRKKKPRRLPAPRPQ